MATATPSAPFAPHGAEILRDSTQNKVRLTTSEYNALIAERTYRARLEAEPVASVEEVEADFAAGRGIDGEPSMQRFRDRYGL